MIDVPRSCVMWGTTNQQTFLKEAHGNRRMVPLCVANPIDIEGLIRDRDLLWAEAVVAEAEFGGDLRMPAEVWDDAVDAQRAHTEHDPWFDELIDVSKIAINARESRYTRRLNGRRCLGP